MLMTCPLDLCILGYVAATLRPGILPTSFVEPLPSTSSWQIHSYNDNTYILRQSGFTDFEKPFLYLLFGDNRAFLFDTGSRYVYE
jgi:hydroxyacylglutathione hydrolase